MGCVYLATNTVNGKRYVGKTIFSLRHRRTQHELSASKEENRAYFINALRKYGVDSFKWRTLYKSDSTDVLNEKEIYFIKALSTKSPHGYNMTDGGEGAVGIKISELTRQRRSAALKGKVPSEKTIAKRRKIGKELWKTEVHRTKMAEAIKNRPSLKGRTYDEIYGDKAQEQREKRSAILTGNVKLSVKGKAAWKNPERKRKARLSYEERFGVEKAAEIRQRQSEAMRAVQQRKRELQAALA